MIKGQRRGWRLAMVLALCCGLAEWTGAQVGPASRPAERRARLGRARQRRAARQAESQPASSLPKGVKALRDLEYAKHDGKPVLLDLYLPESAKGPLPVVVWIHGGGWRGGDKERCPALPMVEKGYAAASINYRLTGEAKFPAQIEDCKAAIRWLRAHAKEYSLDSERIGVWGASAGGHLVALLGTAGDAKDLEGTDGNTGFSSRVQAVCDWYGPTDLVKIDAHKRAAAPGKGGVAMESLLGESVEKNRQKAQKASPITYVSKDDPPFLIMHGDQDVVVPLEQSQVFYDALRKAGVDATLQVIKGAGHGRGFETPEIHKTVEEFFDKHLKKPAAAKAAPARTK